MEYFSVLHFLNNGISRDISTLDAFRNCPGNQDLASILNGKA